MENQDLDLIGQTAGNMPYKIGIVDKDGKLKNQFVAKASTNRIDIPESSLGTGGSASGQLSTLTNLFSGSAFGNILLSGVTSDYSNLQDGLLITFGQRTGITPKYGKYTPQQAFGGYDSKDDTRLDLSPLKRFISINIPKDKLVANSSFDVSDQVSQYIGKTIRSSQYENNEWDDYIEENIVGFKGTAISILPNTTLSVELIVTAKGAGTPKYNYLIPVVQVNTYKN